MCKFVSMLRSNVLSPFQSCRNWSGSAKVADCVNRNESSDTEYTVIVDRSNIFGYLTTLLEVVLCEMLLFVLLRGTVQVLVRRG